MKRIFLFAFFIVPFTGNAQSKLSYDLILNISGVSNSSSKPEMASWNSSTIIRDSSGSPLFIMPGSWGSTSAMPVTSAKEYKAKITAGFTIGAKVGYVLYKNFGIGIGASISYLKATRIVENYSAGTLLSFSGISGVGLSPTVGSNGGFTPWAISPGSYSYSNALSKEEKFQFVTFNIPINVNYTKSKWQLEAGIIPAFIVSSKKFKAAQHVDNSEITYQEEPAFNNNKKTSFNLSINPSYEISKNLRLGLEYYHCVSSGLIKDENVYNLKPRILSLKISYKIK